MKQQAACRRQPQQQQQPEHPAMPKQEQQQRQRQEQQNYQYQHTSARETYKSCDFCAKRKKKCSGDLPRCSLCIEKNQPYCHYQLKPPTKRRAANHLSPQRPSTSSSTDVTVYTRGGAMSVSGTGSVTLVPDSMLTKRCRLSASPATGLVGLQENGFLGDFFGCLGILPLATESTVRNGMVEIMEAVARRQLRHEHEHEYPGNVGFTMEREALKEEGAGTGLADGEEKDWKDALVRRDVSGSPATCIMWCAIALGALMRGSPVEFVNRYISLAQKSLVDCVDGRRIDKARAYLMMSFLYGMVHHEEKNEEYLSMAMNIVAKLRRDDVSKELGPILLTAEKVWVSNVSGNRTKKEREDLNTFCTNVVDLLPTGDVMQQEEICNIFLVSDRRLNQAFIKDMSAQGAFVHVKRLEEHKTTGEPLVNEHLEHQGDGGIAGSPHESARGKGSQLPPCGDSKLAQGWRNGPEPPPSGCATRDFVREALPELQRLSKTLERSDTCSGVGGLLYHGNVAYMKSVKGDMADSFESLKDCAKVLMRYPGIVRFRPHLVHCIIAGSHYSHRKDVYDAVREVYNPNRPPGCAVAPPYEEWTEMRQLCDHVLCRSVQVEVNRTTIKSKSNKQRLEPTAAADERPVAGSSPLRSSPLAVFSSPSTGGEIQSSGSPLVVPALESRCFPLVLATTDTDAAATSPLSEVRPETPLVPQVPHENCTAMFAAGTANKDFHHRPQCMATNDIIPEIVTAVAADTNVLPEPGWRSTEATQKPSAMGVAVPAGDALPDLEVRRELGSEQVKNHWTDADLSKFSAAFMGQQGRAWREAVEEGELL
ncbi:unnamed protein product [Pylaiella littoralis]